MESNAKRDKALASVLTSAMRYFEGADRVDGSDEAALRTCAEFVTCGDYLETAAKMFARAIDLKRINDRNAPVVAFEAYRLLRQSAILSLIIVGNFPFYSDVAEAAPDGPLLQ